MVTSTATENAQNGHIHSSPTSPPISWPLERPPDAQHLSSRVESALRQRPHSHARSHGQFHGAADGALPHDLLPGHGRSLSGIASRSFFLGQASGICLLQTAYLLSSTSSRLWRASFFLSTLSLFHFLEFWVTARYNPPSATTSSFLLTNGRQYQIAHSVALLESLAASFFFPGWQDRFAHPVVLALGVALVVLGQAVRSTAMAHAGTNFNHQVQTSRAAGHELVTSGIYSALRHPSYFGFFWWGLGTQVVLGNPVCFVGYAVVLWRFFSRRIRSEERYLVAFFGEDYVEYRARTRVGIPFIP